jgi:hypothetical protein
MSDERERRRRADELRKQIEELKSVQENSGEAPSAERKPGESPKEYLERRLREVYRKKPGKK